MSYPAADAAKATFCLGGNPYVHTDGVTYAVALGKGGAMCKPVGLPPGKWYFRADNSLYFAPWGTVANGGAEDLMQNPWVWAVAVAAAAFLFLRK